MNEHEKWATKEKILLEKAKEIYRKCNACYNPRIDLNSIGDELYDIMCEECWEKFRKEEKKMEEQNKNIKVNQEKLRKNLIDVYSDYIIDEVKAKAVKKAKKLDGLWSGSFLLDESTEEAINNLTSFYTKPLLSKAQAKKILRKLLKEQQK